MKTTLVYCDRCGIEVKGNVTSITFAGIGSGKRIDTCRTCFLLTLRCALNTLDVDEPLDWLDATMPLPDPAKL